MKSIKIQVQEWWNSKTEEEQYSLQQTYFPQDHLTFENKEKMWLKENFTSNAVLQLKHSNLQSDIRNKLSPIKNLITMMENGLTEGNVEMHNLVLREMETCKESIEYLSNIK